MPPNSNSGAPAAKVLMKVPCPDSLVEVRLSPPAGDFEVKVAPGEEAIILRIRPGSGSFVEVRISPPAKSRALDGLAWPSALPSNITLADGAALGQNAVDAQSFELTASNASALELPVLDEEDLAASNKTAGRAPDAPAAEAGRARKLPPADTTVMVHMYDEIPSFNTAADMMAVALPEDEEMEIGLMDEDLYLDSIDLGDLEGMDLEMSPPLKKPKAKDMPRAKALFTAVPGIAVIPS